MGAEVIIHPVMTHTIDRDIDIAVAHATRAMMQCYVFDMNGLGAGGNGQSCVFDPSGRELYQGDATEQIIPSKSIWNRWPLARTRHPRPWPDGQELPRPPAEFPVYGKDFDTSYLDSLGPLATPRRVERRRPKTSRRCRSGGAL